MSDKKERDQMCLLYVRKRAFGLFLCRNDNLGICRGAGKQFSEIRFILLDSLCGWLFCHGKLMVFQRLFMVAEAVIADAELDIGNIFLAISL